MATLQILHGGIGFAGQAIERSHGVNDVVGFGSGLARAIQMFPRLVPAAQIHQGHALRIVVFRRFRCGAGRREILCSQMRRWTLARSLSSLLGPSSTRSSSLLGAMEFLLLKVLQRLLIEFQLLLLGGGSPDREASSWP